MPEHGHAHHGPPDTSKGYEQSDLEFGSIGKGVVFYFIFTAAIGVVVYLAFLFFHQAEVPSQALSTVPSAPYPVLQNNITARTDIWNLRAREDFLLHNSSYADPSKKTVRVPVDQVIDQLGQSENPSVLNPAPEAPKVAVPKAEAVAPAPKDAFINKGTTSDLSTPPAVKPVRKRRPMPAPLGGSLKIKSSKGGGQ